MRYTIKYKEAEGQPNKKRLSREGKNMSYKISRRKFMKVSAAAAAAAAMVSLTGCVPADTTPAAPSAPPFGKVQTIANGIEVNFKKTELYKGTYLAFIDVTIPQGYLKGNDSIYMKPSDFSAKLDGKDVAAGQISVTYGGAPWSKVDDRGLRTYSGDSRKFLIKVTGPAGASKLQVSYTFEKGEVKETATAEGDVSAETAQ